MKLENTQAQMKKGLLELCVLSTISNKGTSYPTDIINELKKSKLIVVEGTIYPLLNRLKNAAFLGYTWQESKAGPPRKYYHITDSGQIFLNELISTWKDLNTAVNQSLKKTKTK